MFCPFLNFLPFLVLNVKFSILETGFRIAPYNFCKSLGSSFLGFLNCTNNFTETICSNSISCKFLEAQNIFFNLDVTCFVIFSEEKKFFSFSSSEY